MSKSEWKSHPNESSRCPRGHKMYANGIQSGIRRVYRVEGAIFLAFSERLMNAQHGTGIKTEIFEIRTLFRSCLNEQRNNIYTHQ